MFIRSCSTSRRSLLACCGALALLATGASRAAADTLCGCWEGRWESCTDDFEGTVKARITKCGPGRYEAVFTGRAFKIMPYRYKSTLIAWTDPETGCLRFKTTQKLPFWGCYWMRGYVSGCKFVARYNTDDHVGYFRMTRVSCK